MGTLPVRVETLAGSGLRMERPPTLDQRARAPAKGRPGRRLVFTLPGIAVVEPLVASVLGDLVLREHAHLGPTEWVFIGPAYVALLCALIASPSPAQLRRPSWPRATIARIVRVRPCRSIAAATCSQPPRAPRICAPERSSPGSPPRGRPYEGAPPSGSPRRPRRHARTQAPGPATASAAAQA